MKNIIDFSLKNRLMIFVASLTILLGGYFSYNSLPIDAFPDVSPSLVQVFTETEGLAPEEVEKYVTFPIEVAMNGIPNLKKIRSVSNFGLSVVNIYFEDGTDIYFARQLVNERLQEAAEQIPAGFGEPKMGPISTGMGLIIFYYLEDETGKYSLEELRSIQDWIVKFQLQSVPGVTEVLGIGGWEKQFQVQINPNALLKYDLTVNEVVEKIKNNNLNVGAQFIEKNSEEFVVRSLGLATRIDDLKKIVIKSKNGIPIFLTQIADIKIGGAIRRGVQTHNGIKEIVAGMVVKLFGSNSSKVISDVEKKLDAINKSLPEGVKIVPYYEQKTLVESAVKTVTDALLLGIILVTLVLVLFMGSIRPSLVVTFSIPFSIMVAFIGMYFLKISINLMSFGGLAIAIGMMVDATIVLVENIDRKINEKENKLPLIKTILMASKEVLRPIIFSILIIIIVFIPLFTLQGVEGKTFRPLAYTIALAMLGSLIYAVIIAPVVSSLIMKSKSSLNNLNSNNLNSNNLNSDNLTSKENFLLRKIKALYLPIITFFIRKRIVAIILAVLILITGILIFPRLGSEFTPKLKEGTLIVRLSMAPSISLNESTRLTMLAEKRLLKIKEVDNVITRIGRGEVGAHTDPVNSAEMYVILKPKAEWRNGINQDDLEKIIRENFGEIPGVQTNYTQPIEMTVDELLEGVRAELAIKLFGDDLDKLKNTAHKISAVVKKVRGAADIQVDQISGTPQLKININRQAIARYGINVSDVQEVVKTAIGGTVAGQIFEGIKRFDILVRFKKENRSTIKSIKNILIKAPSGLKVPLGELASIEEVVGPRQITREQNQRFITIQCNVLDRDIGSFVKEAQKAIDSEIKLPVGYFTTWGGQFKLQQEANKRFAIVIPATLIIIFFFLFISFKSFKNSLLILFNIPLALVGGILSLWIFDMNLSVPSSVGFIALFGIALENGMVLITYLNKLVKDKVEINEASITGAVLRIRPVLMTALTTALGLIPLLLSTGTGSEVQKPLAVVVVGGLFTSTILTLLVLPALYKWFKVK